MKIDLTKIPSNPWVYFFQTNSGKNLYIWKAKNLNKRIAQYFSASSIWKQEMLSKADKIDFLVVQSENEAILLEMRLITKFRPPYNSLIKWENSYVYIKISKDKYPLISFTRFRENDGSIYIWPKNQRKDLTKLLQLIRLLFQYRSCKNTQFNTWKICSDYLFGICKWRCIYNKIDLNQNKYELEATKLWFKKDLEHSQNDYKKIIDLIVSFFKWRTKKVEDYIYDQISLAIEKQNFERAWKLRDILFNIKNLTETQSVIIEKKINWYFFKIKQIWDSYIYSITNFFEWKLIDSLRFKEDLIDTDLKWLIAKIETELWEMKYEIDNNGNVFGHSSAIKTTKSTLEEISKLSDNFLDSFIISSSFSKDNVISGLLDWLQNKYNLEKYPYRIECIDISHLSWDRISGWLSCFIWWISDKRLYRKYKITWEFTWWKVVNNDYAALKEVLTRRLKSQDKDNLPDIMVIDWGKWQLNIIKELINETTWFQEILQTTQFVALEKWESRKRSWKISWEKESLYILSSKNKISKKEFNYDEYDRLLVKIRDEAHRFANYFRKQQMKKEFK